jgi:hypothetical protein
MTYCCVVDAAIYFDRRQAEYSCEGVKTTAASPGSLRLAGWRQRRESGSGQVITEWQDGYTK